MQINDLYDRYQSAYCKNHSTASPISKVHGDISESLDEGFMIILVLLDLSAAFDVIDHSMLIRRLEYTFGTEREALS